MPPTRTDPTDHSTRDGVLALRRQHPRIKAAAIARLVGVTPERVRQVLFDHRLPTSLWMGVWVLCEWTPCLNARLMSRSQYEAWEHHGCSRGHANRARHERILAGLRERYRR